MPTKRLSTERRAFLTGAGFSAEDGVPTVRKFFDGLLTYSARKKLLTGEETKRIISLADQLCVKSPADIEEFLSMLEAARSIVNTTADESNRLSEIHQTMISLVTAYIGAFRLRPRSPIRAFARRLRPGDVVATFNWDSLLESALQSQDKQFCYGLNPNTISVLKLHGSYDWVLLFKGEEPERGWRKIHGRVHQVTNFRDYLTRGGDLKFPALSPPQFPKYLPRELDYFWSKAYESLSSAHKVVVIGYSFSEFDTGSQVLVRLSLAGGSGPQRKVILVNRNKQVGTRLRALVRIPVVHRRSKFGVWIRSPRQVEGDLGP